jgi:hypothetical protein
VLVGIATLLTAAACGDDGESGGSGGNAGSAGSGGTSGAAGSGAAGGSGGTAGSAGSGAAGGTGGASGSSGAAGSAGTGPCTLGTSWSLVDELPQSSGDASAATAIAIDPSDTIYVAGTVTQGATTTNRVRKSSDGGQTWQDAGTFGPSFRGITTDAAGNVYIGGLAKIDASAPFHSVMLRSTDGAATFEQVDDFFVDAANPCWGNNVASGPDGAIYGSSWCFASTGSRWIVRKSSDQGESWSTVLDFAGGASAVVVVDVSQADEVYVAGQHPEWHVHQRTAQGAWSGIDDYSLASGKGALPTHVRALSRTYVLGVARDAGDVPHYLVRRRDGGTWTTLDDVASPIVSSLGGSGGVHEDGSGAIIVTHGVPDASDVVHAITRRSDDDGASWQTVDDYQYASGKPTRGGSLRADSAGNLYAVFEGVDAADKGHWLVRKLACQ